MRTASRSRERPALCASEAFRSVILAKEPYDGRVDVAVKRSKPGGTRQARRDTRGAAGIDASAIESGRCVKAVAGQGVAG